MSSNVYSNVWSAGGGCNRPLDQRLGKLNRDDFSATVNSAKCVSNHTGALSTLSGRFRASRGFWPEDKFWPQDKATCLTGNYDLRWGVPLNQYFKEVASHPGGDFSDERPQTAAARPPTRGSVVGRSPRLSSRGSHFMTEFVGKSPRPFSQGSERMTAAAGNLASPRDSVGRSQFGLQAGLQDHPPRVLS